MDVFEAIIKRRSVRSFSQEAISQELLTKLIDAARVGPSGANRQPLEYVVVTEADLCQQVFDCLKWAAYTAPRGTPAAGFTPTAYVAVCVNTELYLEGIYKYDVGAAIQTMLLLGVANGLGSTWLKSINVPKLTKIMEVPEGVELDSIVAFGQPAEEPVLVDLEPAQEGQEVIKYWRDDDDKQFVPKRHISNVLHWQKYGG
jgi:nitroreductase